LLAIEQLQRICEAGSTGEGASRALDLLSEVADTADPDQALLHLDAFLSGLRAPQTYVDLLHERPLLRRQLVNLFAQSELLARYFVGHPELIDLLLQWGLDDIRKGPSRINQELGLRLSRDSDAEERLAAMRRFKNEETLRIALNDISDDLSVPEVAGELTAIADGILAECLSLVEAEMRERYGEVAGPSDTQSLAVIGMGKLGGVELGYHSDLDLIFVYSGRGEQESTGAGRGRLGYHEYFAKLAQRLLALLHMRLREGYLYKVDTRLRPSGNKGTLVVSAQTLRDYHGRYAQLWERQALTKARGCAGNLKLFAEIQEQIIHPVVYVRALPDDAAQQIDRLRRRMEREISGEAMGDFNAKTGHGGMVDVEFVTQYLQMRHGREFSALRTTQTLTVLDALREVGVLAGVSYRVLKDGYLFLRKVENRLRLMAGYSQSQLPREPQSLHKLARLMGYLGNNAAHTFMQDYRHCTDEIRMLYSQLMRTFEAEVWA
jgi:glutamate-ammonia-ligase adenylyltransferase